MSKYLYAAVAAYLLSFGGCLTGGCVSAGKDASVDEQTKALEARLNALERGKFKGKVSSKWRGGIIGVGVVNENRIYFGPDGLFDIDGEIDFSQPVVKESLTTQPEPTP